MNEPPRTPRDLTVFLLALILGLLGTMTVLTICCAAGIKTLTIVRDFFA